MRITRRDFTKQAGTVILLAATGGSVFMTGCNVAQDILDWEPLGLAAFNGVVSILETYGILAATPGLAVVIQLVRTGFADLAQDAQLYLSIQPPPSGALNEIETVLGLIASNLKALFSQIATSIAPIINLVIGLAQLILGTIAGFLAKLSPKTALPMKAVSATDTSFQVANQTYNFTAVTPNKKKFRDDWNKICASQGHPELYVY